MIILPVNALEECDERTKQIVQSVLERLDAQLIDAHQLPEIKFNVKKDKEMAPKIKK